MPEIPLSRTFKYSKQQQETARRMYLDGFRMQAIMAAINVNDEVAARNLCARTAGRRRPETYYEDREKAYRPKALPFGEQTRMECVVNGEIVARHTPETPADAQAKCDEWSAIYPDGGTVLVRSNL